MDVAFNNGKETKKAMKPEVVSIALLLLIVLGYWLFSCWREPPPYHVLEIPDLLTDAQCDALVAAALERGLKPSEVLDATGTSTLDLTHRTSDQTWYRDSEHPVAAHLAEMASKLAGTPTTHQEQLQVVRYRTGGHFRDHHDAFFHETMNRLGGPRRATLLVYLNDDFEGGDTVFERIGTRIRPRKGKGVFFWNTDEEDRVLPVKDPIHSRMES